jgi:hypothetical protein
MEPLDHAAALMTAAFIARGEQNTPEDAARLFFECQKALNKIAKEVKGGR